MTLEQLEANVKARRDELNAAILELESFKTAPEQNVFSSLEEAEGVLEERMRGWAHEDCEGSYNCGSPEYEQEFIVDGKHYKAFIEVEYNRHDKTYYYIDSVQFRIDPL